MDGERFDRLARALGAGRSRRALLGGLAKGAAAGALAASGLAAGVRAVVGGYVEVHDLACPPDYDPNDLFTTCHDHRRQGVRFVADGPGGRRYEDVTDAEGRVVFGDFLEAGQVTLAQAIPEGDFADYAVFCSRLDTGATIPVEKRRNGRAAAILTLPQAVVDAGTGVVCDWYELPAAPATTPVAGEAPDGGLGLLWSDWEQIHGPGTPAGPVTTYEQGRYAVAFTAGVVTFLEVDWSAEGGRTLAQARAAVSHLIPADAALDARYTLPPTPSGPIGLLAEHSTSDWLAERLHGLTPAWDGGVLVVYQQAETGGNAPPILRVSLAAGNRP